MDADAASNGRGSNEKEARALPRGDIAGKLGNLGDIADGRPLGD